MIIPANVEVKELKVLTAPDMKDSCDGCGARAKHRFELETGGEVLMCDHHARQNWVKLVPKCSGYGYTTDAQLMPEVF